MCEAVKAAFRRIIVEIRERLSAAEDGDPAAAVLKELERDPVLYNFERHGLASLGGLRSWGRFVDDRIQLHGQFAAECQESSREDVAQRHARIAEALHGLSSIALEVGE